MVYVHDYTTRILELSMEENHFLTPYGRVIIMKMTFLRDIFTSIK